MTNPPTIPPAESHADCLILKTGRQDCTINFFPASYQLQIGEGEQRIDLGYSGSRLLERLLRNPGEVVSREELLQYAWSDRVVGQGSLNQQVYILRHILGDEKERQIIQTLPRRGYLFNYKFLLSPVSNSSTDTTLPAHQALPLLAPTTSSTSINARTPLGIQFYAGLAVGCLLSFIALQVMQILAR
jgi:cholera toxin transcriptional activator